MAAAEPYLPLPEGLVYPVLTELFRAPQQHEMWAFWQAARGAAPIAPEGCIDPTAMPRAALPFIVLYAVDDGPDRMQIRLEGTEVVEILKRSRRGKIVGEAEGTVAHKARLVWALENRLPYWVEARIDYEQYHYRTYSALVLPFGKEGRVTRIVGVNGFD